MNPFSELFFLGITTPIRLVCDVVSGITEGISWHLATEIAHIPHCEIPSDVIPTISCAYRIGRPVKVIAESVTGPVHLVVRPNDWIETVFRRFKKKEVLRIATWKNLFRGQETSIKNHLICVSQTHLKLFRETITRPRGIYDTPRVTDEERVLFLENT
ncbi:MAG: hypothetical protein HGB03_01785 [Candidatus Yonathbacteria bacterium]|nr:hypothetical protein [Candidatus Yonathbacteria bacterium]NTW47990.1 hypothetical protein [Candidatus Yonathbacteria bacterium]